jgi:imidazolonepropionase-like amidohydrolase
MQGRPVSLTELETIKNEYLRCGVFAVSDMGNKYGAGLLARKILKGNIQVRTSGYALFKKGTYGAFLGKGVEGKDAIRRAVGVIAASGADFLKVINSGIVSTSGGHLVTDGGFPEEELKVLCEEARRSNLEVACHANSDKAIRDAVSAGVSSIEHGFFVSEQTLRIMAEAGVTWTPTAFALAALASSLTQGEKKYLDGVVEEHLSSICFASSVGVRLRVGTDSGARGVDHGGSFFEELKLFRKAGLSHDQILSAACMAKEEMNKGNFLVVRGDFIETGRIESVYAQSRPRQ